MKKTLFALTLLLGYLFHAQSFYTNKPAGYWPSAIPNSHYWIVPARTIKVLRTQPEEPSLANYDNFFYLFTSTAYGAFTVLVGKSILVMFE